MREAKINENTFTSDSVHEGCINIQGDYNEYHVDADCRFDDCNHLRFYDKSDPNSGPIYLHIDELDEFIEFLQDLSEARSTLELDPDCIFDID